MTPDLLSRILDHARSEAPREACGVLVWDGRNGADYRPCRNLADAGQFQIHPEDWVAAEDGGKPLGIVHSHPGGDLQPSTADLEGCARSGLPWWIVTLDGAWNRFTPPGWSTRGRPYAWGVQDCYTLVRDALQGLPDILRDGTSEDLFRLHLEASGFTAVDDPPGPGDALLLSIPCNGRPNHCGVYMGGGQILHHLRGRLSREEHLGPLHRAVTSVMRRCA